jgi:predicted enzyme related to lactoylglutathione lyase
MPRLSDDPDGDVGSGRPFPKSGDHARLALAEMTDMLKDSPLYAYFPALDMARARKFYEGTLGLVPQQDVNGGVVYAFAGGTAAFLYPTPNAGTSKASQAFWAVADVDAEIEALKRRGVVFENYDTPGERSPAGAVIAGGAKAAWFKDSEGNILALIQSL